MIQQTSNLSSKRERSVSSLQLTPRALAQEVLVALQPVLQQQQLPVDFVGAHGVVGGNIHTRAFQMASEHNF